MSVFDSEIGGKIEKGTGPVFFCRLLLKELPAGTLNL